MESKFQYKPDTIWFYLGDFFCHTKALKGDSREPGENVAEKRVSKKERSVTIPDKLMVTGIS